MSNIYKRISRFERLKTKSAKKNKRYSKRLKNINPECYVAREIFYQTALLHELMSKEEARQTHEIQTCEKRLIKSEDSLVTVSFELHGRDWYELLHSPH